MLNWSEVCRGFRVLNMRTETEYVFVDTETTGLDYRTDELLSVSVVDHYGRCIFHSLVKPERKKSWNDAERIHGISFEMVRNAPRFKVLKPMLNKIFKGKHVVAYNMNFDSVFLGSSLRHAASLHCCMKAYAEYHGEYDPVRQSFKWKKLTDAVKNCNPDFVFRPHSSLDDSMAAREVWLSLMKHKSIAEKYGFYDK